MSLIAWATIGLLIGIASETLARFVAAETRLACSQCGLVEVGPSWSALLRLGRRGTARCNGCGSWSLLWLSCLAPALALSFGLLATRWSWGTALLVYSAYAGVLLLIAVLDLRHRLVYPAVIYPATLAAIVATPLVYQQPIWSGLAGALIGTMLFFGLYLLAGLLYRRRGVFGLGDVMIAGLIGAMSGWPGVAGALIAGALLGGVGAILIGLGQRSRRAHFAYGPALCLGSLLMMLGLAR